MGLFSTILNRFANKSIDWDELEEILIGADLGIHLSRQLIDTLQEKARKLKGEDIVTYCREEIKKLLPSSPPPLQPLMQGPQVILITGVNGVGKTTCCAKLAYSFKQKGYQTMLAAADTFRAAAIEQLDVWAQRIEVPIVKGQYKADPSSVCYDAYVSAVKKETQFLLCDTAGRLHTRHNLMEELGKIKRTLGKNDQTAPHETFLVVDATTGSNALNQANEFHNAIGLTGVIVTKMDGSGKGGVVVAIQHELQISTRYIGTGELITDLQPFDPQAFVEQMV